MRSSMPPKMSNLIPDLNSPSKPTILDNKHVNMTFSNTALHKNPFIKGSKEHHIFTYHQTVCLGLYQFHIYSFQMPW